MPRKIAPLVLIVGLILSVCSKKPKQESESVPPASAGQADKSNPPAQPPSAATSAQPSTDSGGTSTAAAPPQTATPPPKAEWTDAHHPASQVGEVKAPETSWNHEAPLPKPQSVVIPAGAHITIRLNESIDAKKNKAGDSFEGSVDQPVVIGGKTVIPKSSLVNGTVVEAVPAGKLKGEGRLAIALTQIKVQGGSYAISTATVSTKLHGKGKRSAVMIGGGGGAGALVGGLIGGGKGAAIGAALGGGAGAAGATMTGNEQLAFTAESALTFTLKQPLKLTDRTPATKVPEPGPDRGQSPQ